MSDHRVLLVDDERHVTAALRRALHRDGHEIHEARSAQDALLQMNRHEFDVVVSDQQMPGMPGLEFLKMVRQVHPRTARIVLTGNATVDLAVRAINEGQVHRFFVKPCNEADLRQTIRQLLRHRDLVEQSTRLLREYRRRTSVLDALERSHPGITRVDLDDSGAIVLGEVGHDTDALLDEIRLTLASRKLEARAATREPVP